MGPTTQQQLEMKPVTNTTTAVATRPSDPMQMLAILIERDADPDKLDRLMDLAERWQTDQAKRAYAAAMMDAQRRMPVVVKDKSNDHTRSRYASLERVQSDIRDVYLKHGFTVTFSEADHDVDGWLKLKATVTHEQGHTEEFFNTGPIDDKGPKGNAVKSALHGTQSTRSYLQRNMLLDIFGVVVADRDTDGNAPAVTINDSQADELDSLCKALNDDSATYRKVIKFYGIEKIADLPAHKFNEAKARLQKRLAEQEGGAS